VGHENSFALRIVSLSLNIIRVSLRFQHIHT